MNTGDGRRVGWLDLDTRERSLEMLEFASDFDAALQEAATIDEKGRYSPRRNVTQPVMDLADRRPGEHLEAQIAATIDAGRELKPAIPGFEGRRAYSSWELGVLGERAVADELDRLVELDPRWAFLNSIPVGTHKSDIDHLVVGPGGVFTVNAKHHHGCDVWVAEGAFRLNHSWQHYVEHSRARRDQPGRPRRRRASRPVRRPHLALAGNSRQEPPDRHNLPNAVLKEAAGGPANTTRWCESHNADDNHRATVRRL